MSDVFASSLKSTAQAAAYAAVENMRSTPTAIIEYQSRGQVLAIGEAQSLDELPAIPEPLTAEYLRLDSVPSDALIEISGALGQFEVVSGKQRYKADLILDLSPRPILSMALKPPGYLSLDDCEDAQDALQQLESLTGVFEKPKYFNYDASLCAHGRSGKPGCSRCIDACPAEAIVSSGDGVEVDPYRCHGGGICATVCPSGAISYAYPNRENLLEHLRSLIFAYREAGGGAPSIAFVDEAQQQDVQHNLPATLIICVEEVASVGPEICLSALAWGAQNVLLFNLHGMPESSRAALDLTLEMVVDILRSMHYPAGSVALISNGSELLSIDSMPRIPPAKHAALDQKRQAFYLALDHLVNQAQKTRPVISLPAGSMFGEAIVQAESCTLCMACVSACPGNVLQDGGENPQLGFVEANCLQCGICTSTCPEDAISISPRILFDPKLRVAPRVLYAESPFHCISCGRAFATSSGITTILSRLAGHAMFADERARSRLKMCSDCRVKDMMEDPNSDI